MRLMKNMTKYDAAIYDENDNLKANYYIREFNEETINQITNILKENCKIEISKMETPHPGDFEDANPGDLFINDSKFFTDYNFIYKKDVTELRYRLKELNLYFYLADRNGVVFKYIATLENFSVLRIWKETDYAEEVLKLKLDYSDINIIERYVNPYGDNYDMIYIGTVRRLFEFLENKIRIFASINS